MRYLAIDLGSKRTGFAVGDDQTRIASPVEVVQATSDAHRLREIGRLIDQYAPDALVVGMPLNMDGSEGPGVQKAREVADRLTQRFGLPVHLVDERLTSEAANVELSQRGLTHKGKKARRDALAAAVILRNYFESL